MATGRRNRPKGAPPNPVRSVRVDDPTWEKATRRAAFEGVTMSEVLALFIKGYGDGLINAPRTQVVYAGALSPPTQAAPTAQS